MNDCIIKTVGLGFTYDDGDELPTAGGEIPALADVDIEIHRGEYLAVLGHNGSGKSTFAKLLNMILVPTVGKIYIDGVDVTREDFSEDDVFEIRRKVGMVFQNPDNQLVATVVEEDVAFGPENLGIPQPELRARVDEALATVGMSAYAHHEPHRLSGGQKQRVAIAGIIAMKPRCMIFDESTAMLDPVGRREVLETIEKLNREEGITVISITHYMDEAARADRVIVLSDGQLVLDGTPGEVFTHSDTLRAVGLDLPQCTAVSQHLITKDLPVHGEINTPEQCAEAILNAWKKM